MIMRARFLLLLGLVVLSWLAIPFGQLPITYNSEPVGRLVMAGKR
jgi:hypothetical protein